MEIEYFSRFILLNPKGMFTEMTIGQDAINSEPANNQRDGPSVHGLLADGIF